ncbi:hypothetical protein C6P42_000521 [Pichia californica]|nr:hypothetical protein C6P42_000521 [[Candida] californica]
MKQYPVCHTTIRGGVYSDASRSRLENQIDLHNYVNRIDVLVDNADLDLIFKEIQNIQFESVIVESTLNNFIKFICLLDIPIRKNLKLVMLDKDITHENIICMNDGIMTMKLRADTYLKSGFQFKKSAFSHGNKKLHTQMYIHNFDLCKLEENIKQQSKNDIRLLWFTENIDTNKYRFIISHKLPLENIIGKIVESDIFIQKHQSVKPEIFKMKDCISPDLLIEKDEETLEELLEWITFVSLCGKQVNSHVDPYISRYSSILDIKRTRDLGVISIDKILMTSTNKKAIFQILSRCTKCFAVSYYGVKDVTRTYKLSGEHTFVDDGANNLIVFVNESKYVTWSVTDSGDPN